MMGGECNVRDQIQDREYSGVASPAFYALAVKGSGDLRKVHLLLLCSGGPKQPRNLIGYVGNL